MTKPVHNCSEENVPDWLIGRDETSQLIRSIDWSLTALGQRDTWPLPLQIITNIVLSNPFPMAILWGNEFIFIYNDSYRVIAGDRHPHAMGRSTREIWPEVWEFNKPIFEKVIQTGESVYFEDQLFRIRRQSEMIDAYFTLSYSPIWLEKGLVGGTLVTLLETTERKRAETTLRLSEEKFRAMFDKAPLGYQSLDSEGRFIDVNQTWLDTLGYAREEVIGHWFGEFLAPAYVEAFRKRFPMFKAAGQTHTEFEMLHKDGSVHLIAFEGRIGYNQDGGFKQTHCILQDITERKQAEEALRESEKKYRTLAEAAHDLITLLDRNGRIKYTNNVAAAQLGISPHELVGKNIIDIFRPEIAERQLTNLREVLKNGMPLYVEAQVDFRSKLTWLGTWLTPVKDEHEEVEEVLIVSRDITERKRAEMQTQLLLNTIQLEKEKLSGLINSISDEVWFADTQKRFTLANPSALQEFGYHFTDQIEIEELARSLEIYNPDGSPRPVEEAPPLRALRGEIVKNMEEIVQTPASGELRYRQVSSSPVKDASGKIIGAVSVVRDITERKQAENREREQDRLNQKLLDSLPCVALLMRPKTREIVAMNKAAMESGCSIGQTCFQTWAKFEEPCPWCLAPKLWAEGQQQKLEVEALGIVWDAHWDKVSDDLYLHYAFDITERKQAEEERDRLLNKLKISSDQLKILSHRLMEVQENECRNLVRKLHDEIGQNLTALSINMNIIKSQLPAKLIEKIGSRINDSLRLNEDTVGRVRDLMAELRPPVLDDYGIVAALNWYSNQFSERTGITTVVEGSELTLHLPLETETAIFRVAQEALTNVTKHAKAKQVTITLKRMNGKVLLIIADNGIGFEQQQQQQWGLTNMRERIQAVGGKFIIESTPGKGTKVVVEVPIIDT